MISFRKSSLQRVLQSAVQWIGCAAFIALISYLSILFVRLLDSWMKLWESRVNSFGAHLVQITHTAYHAIQVKVQYPHHEIQVEVLYAHHRWITLNGTLTPGELIVGLATLLVAAVTWNAARAPYILAQYNAACEDKRHKWQVQGVARLVLGELTVINTNVERALAEGRWHWFYPLPCNTWEHDGALIAESLSEDRAAALIEIYTHLTNWETITAQAHQQHPNTGSLSLNPKHKSILGELQDSISDASRYLRKLAYPNACERDRQLAHEREFIQERIDRLRRGSAARSRSQRAAEKGI
jgi:hypothetical protein